MVPYSDNMYSMDDSDVEPLDSPVLQNDRQDRDQQLDDNQLLSPSDGFFRASSLSSSGLWSNPSTQSATAAAASSQVPHVPDVWVEDPSLAQGSTAESKAREAAQERSANRALNTRHLQTSPQVSLPPKPSRASRNLSTYSPSHSRGSFSTSGQPTYHRHTPSSSGGGRSSTGRTASIYSERSSILPSDAPPAYTPSPTSPSSASGQPVFSRNYRTFSQSSMGRDEETRGLLADEPQSMGGDPSNEFEDITPVWKERVRRRVPFLNGRNCRMVALGLLLFLLALGFLLAAIQGVKDDVQKLPVHPPNDNVQRPPENSPPAAPMDPPKDYPAYDGDLVLTNNMCKGTKYQYPRQQFPLSFSTGQGLLFEQKKTIGNRPDSHHRDVRVSGDVVVRRNAAESSSITIEMISNDENIAADVQFYEEGSAQSILLDTVQSVSWRRRDASPCLMIRATIWVPENAELNYLQIDTIHLGIKLLDNLSLRVEQFVSLKTTIGQVTAATTGQENNTDLMHGGAPEYFALNSRHVSVETISSPITGAWPLYDQLHIKSTSGSIKVGIDPKPVDKRSPEPAELSIETISGSMEFWEPVAQAQEAFSIQQQEGDRAVTTAEKLIPPREYHVGVSTTSGSIKGGVAFTQLARFSGISSEIAVALLPVMPTSWAEDGTAKKYCDLTTSTTSGTTVMSVYKPMWVDSSDNLRYLPAPNPPNPPNAPNAPDAPAEPAPPSENLGSREPYILLPPPSFQPPVASGDVKRTPEQERREQEARSIKSFLHVLNSHHHTTSAQIYVKYPGAWEGNIQLEALSGKLEVVGDGVEIIKRGDHIVGKTLVAKKGDVGDEEGSFFRAESTSGHIKLEFPA